NSDDRCFCATLGIVAVALGSFNVLRIVDCLWRRTTLFAGMVAVFPLQRSLWAAVAACIRSFGGDCLLFLARLIAVAPIENRAGGCLCGAGFRQLWVRMARQADLLSRGLG